MISKKNKENLNIKKILLNQVWKYIFTENMTQLCEFLLEKKKKIIPKMKII